MSILVSDFDGTFLTDKNDIEINIEAIKQFIKAGNYFALSSGRPLDSILNQTYIYGIPFTHIGSSDGNFMFDAEGRKIYSRSISHEVESKIQELKKLKIYEQLQYAYPKSSSTYYEPDKELGSISFVIKEENITDEFLELFNRLKEENPNYKYDIYGFHGIFYYMVRPKGISKSCPIAKLSTLLHIPKEDIYTIGDNVNDIELVRDYNGFMIGNNRKLEEVALGKYEAVHELVEDIQNRKVLKRW